MGPVAGLRGDEHVHLVGIGGAGMSAIARVLLERGHPVSGSDLRDSPLVRLLAEQGARVLIGHAPSHIQGADMVVATSAAQMDNPELEEARRLGLPVWHRGEMLRRLTSGRRCLAVAGTHGKTTTTAMLILLLRAAGLDPSFIVGGEVPELEGNGHAGQGPHFVIEADEYDHTFLALQPAIAVVTNVEWDHVDCYPSLEAVKRSFAAFVEVVPAEGRVFFCRDDVGAWSLPRPAAPVLSYGFSPEADWRAGELVCEPHSSTFTVMQEGRTVGRFHLGIPGTHNISNALAALAVASSEGVDICQVGAVLGNFEGVKRRFQQLGMAGEVAVVDDYAHHPSEVEATLSAARQRFPGRRLVVVFQPHTYSRTRIFGPAFARVLGQADLVLVTGIYAAREQDPGDISGETVAGMVSCPADYVPTLDGALDWLLERLQPGDVLLTLGAGDITKLGPRVLESREGPEEGLYGIL